MADDPALRGSDWHEAREALLDDRYEALARLSRRTVELARSMEPVLKRVKHDRLMERILPKLYGPYLSGKSDLPATFEKACNRLDAVEDEEEIQSLEELEDGWRVARKEITDELLDVVSSRRKREVFMMLGSEEEQSESTRRMTRIRQLRTDRKELDERFREMLYAMMGEPLPAIETPGEWLIAHGHAARRTPGGLRHQHGNDRDRWNGGGWIHRRDRGLHVAGRRRSGCARSPD